RGPGSAGASPAAEPRLSADHGNRVPGTGSFVNVTWTFSTQSLWRPVCAVSPVAYVTLQKYVVGDVSFTGTVLLSVLTVTLWLPRTLVWVSVYRSPPLFGVPPCVLQFSSAVWGAPPPVGPYRLKIPVPPLGRLSPLTVELIVV